MKVENNEYCFESNLIKIKCIYKFSIMHRVICSYKLFILEKLKIYLGQIK